MVTNRGDTLQKEIDAQESDKRRKRCSRTTEKGRDGFLVLFYSIAKKEDVMECQTDRGVLLNNCSIFTLRSNLPLRSRAVEA